MRPRHAVLLTASKSFHPTQLLYRQHFVRVSPLDATLMSYPVNVANKRLTVGLSPLDATLTKIRGRGPQLFSEAVSPSGHSPFPLPPIPFVFILLRTLLHNGTGTTLFQSISYALFSSRRRVYPLTASWISPLDANCHTMRPTLFSSLLRYLSTRFARLLLHCSPHGSPTPRPTFSRRSPLARRDRARYSRLAAFHRSARARRSALLDRNRFRTR